MVMVFAEPQTMIAGPPVPSISFPEWRCLRQQDGKRDQVGSSLTFDQDLVGAANDDSREGVALQVVVTNDHGVGL